ncbi:hypothetical protein HDIA_2643 [Hartmannibacter diazotrophicus]|uniref:Ubiquinol-cytochrome c chaperone domain-containing protein n=1 Tax=Hartmannibacter diazotrophicus TaxID=1482074 RepID=A0A2C9D777_9HYPH|nr:ubiquinol-cytochrome C chaperone family protein [Hartmannibacter diazotrophicus]SON56184.1 hypothetical protein HDIA_2643 [Hartmannibacter diazotrophicus]
MILQLLRRRRTSGTVDRLYGAVMATSRDPAYYTDFAVADTVEGRFDLLMLHVVLVVRRLQREGDGDKAMAQTLTEAFFADMDRTIREMGIGDLSVPKRMKKISQAFFGRYTVYDQAINAKDREGLAEALQRNIYDALDERAEAAQRLAGHVLKQAKALDDMTIPDLSALSGSLPVKVSV